MPLIKADLRTDTWSRVKADVEGEKAKLMKENCSTKLSHDQTQAIRGRIAECNRLLALETSLTTVPRQGDSLPVDESAQVDAED